MNSSILDRIALGAPLISDGATGTYLQAHGLEPGGCPEELNASRPDLVSGMALEYFDAGSEMVLTNSFGGSRFMLKKYGYGNRVNELNTLASQNARAAAPSGKYVVGSVGPTGEFLEPLGEVSAEEMRDVFGEQMSALKEGGADAFMVETMTSTEEAVIAIEAAHRDADIPIMISMTFDKGPRGYFTMMGVSAERAVRELRDAGADVVGANCGNGIDGMVDIAAEILSAGGGHTVIHSNAGMPQIYKGRIVYPETPEFMSSRFRTLADMGVRVIGGCCGTTPAHVKFLSEIINGTTGLGLTSSKGGT